MFGLDEYVREIEFIYHQNNVECDLYEIVARVIKERGCMHGNSLRNISARRRTGKNNGKEKFFWGVSGFPDLVFLNEEFKYKKPDKKYINGAVEIKSIGDKLEETNQIKGHVFWFDKLIYTNGLVWKIYNFDFDDNQKEVIAILQEKTYYDRNNKTKLENIDGFNDLIKIFDEKKAKDEQFKEFEIIKCQKDDFMPNETQWNELIKYLDKFKISK